MGNALECANESDEFQIDDDETFSLNDIEKEINALNSEDELDDLNSDEELENSDSNEIKPTSNNLNDKLYELRNQLDEIIQNFDSNIQEDDELQDIEIDDELDNQLQDIEIDDELDNQLQEIEITDDDIDAALADNEIDETLGMSYPNKRATTGNIPDKEYQTQGNVQRMRFSMRESERRINGLINENK